MRPDDERKIKRTKSNRKVRDGAYMPLQDAKHRVFSRDVMHHLPLPTSELVAPANLPGKNPPQTFKIHTMILKHPTEILSILQF